MRFSYQDIGMRQRKYVYNVPEHIGHAVNRKKSARKKSHRHDKKIIVGRGILMRFCDHAGYNAEARKKKAVQQQLP
jgi:hypothetical protein